MELVPAYPFECPHCHGSGSADDFQYAPVTMHHSVSAWQDRTQTVLPCPTCRGIRVIFLTKQQIDDQRYADDGLWLPDGWSATPEQTIMRPMRNRSEKE